MPPILCLTYHQIRPAADAHYLYAVTPEQFAAHLEVLAPAAGRCPPAAQISFDDGDASIYEHALPRLQACHTRATLFITAGWIGSRPGFLTWTQLAELARLGHAIQSHSWSHPFLPACGPRQLGEELRQSKQVLEDRLGLPVTEISMPAGRWNRRVLAACAAAGYTRVFTSDAGARPRSLAGVQIIGRYMARRQDTAAAIAAWLAADPAALRWLRLRRLAGRGLQGLLGDRLYHWLWLRWSRAPANTAAEIGYQPGNPPPPG